jgi:hypothetical protein
VPKRLLLFLLCLVALPVTLISPVDRAQAAAVKALFYPLTGEVRLFNPNNAPLPLVFYEISYPSGGSFVDGGLNSTPSVWKSIADNYDASGNQLVDSVNQWTKLLNVNNPRSIAEGLFNGNTSALPALRTISLGKIWNPNLVLPEDFTVHVQTATAVDAQVIKEVTLDGDYLPSGTVDAADFTSWKTFLGQQFAGIADGNLNGAVDAGDYNIWRDNLGATLVGTPFFSSGSGGGGLGAAPVPEPTGCVLAIIGSALLWQGRRVRSLQRAA